jgi:hypothetical protein
MAAFRHIPGRRAAGGARASRSRAVPLSSERAACRSAGPCPPPAAALARPYLEPRQLAKHEALDRRRLPAAARHAGHLQPPQRGQAARQRQLRALTGEPGEVDLQQPRQRQQLRGRERVRRAQRGRACEPQAPQAGGVHPQLRERAPRERVGSRRAALQVKILQAGPAASAVGASIGGF